MYCYVYKGDLKEDYYLYSNREIVDDEDQGTTHLNSDPSSAPDKASDKAPDKEIPSAIISLMGNLSLVVEFELDLDRKLPQAEPAQVMQDIAEKGFYLQLPKKDMRAIEERYFN